MKWVDNPNIRFRLYSDIINTGNRKEIATVVNTLIQKKIEADFHEKKVYEQDRKLLNNTQNILFKELAISLNTTFEEINEMVIRLIKAS
ncbi:hypothetical protein ACFVSW_15440 [Neobacillus sp. NPDC058068]|uniref:hypothetical protein n=1 Tax=Neobacillus sp. NPDC058068 TaxID=3346325 RepID=UPI0036DB8A0E